MALIKSVRGFTPEIGKDAYLAENATIIGDVKDRGSLQSMVQYCFAW